MLLRVLQLRRLQWLLLGWLPLLVAACVRLRSLALAWWLGVLVTLACVCCVRCVALWWWRVMLLVVLLRVLLQCQLRLLSLV